MFQKANPHKFDQMHFVNIESDFTGNNLTKYIDENKQAIKQRTLQNSCWTLAYKSILKIKRKIEEKGIPLKDWDVKINYGIKTGCNEAFIIDTATKERLCKEDPKSAEIIKPILRGRDIGKYKYKWSNKWIFLVKFGFWKELNKFSAIKQYLLKYEKKLKNRGQCRYSRTKKTKANEDFPGQHHWLELDNNPKDEYINLFEKEKIVWARVTSKTSFSFISEHLYTLDSMVFFTGKNIKFILSILNSKLITFFIKTYVHKLGKKGFLLSNQYVEKVPIPKIPLKEQQPFIKLVDKILSHTKSKDYEYTSSKKQAIQNYQYQIDQMVYNLYELTDKEIRIIEKKSNNKLSIEEHSA
jgi:hypothetical protein